MQNFFRLAAGGGGQAPANEEGSEEEQAPKPDDHLHEGMDVQCENQDFALDFVSLSITFGNGTVVGGTGTGQ
jgi:hypothetical protein